jgi:1,4-alpha-glucan branching enzyme
VVVIVNFTPVPRENYRIGMPGSAPYTEIFNSDDARYGGGGVGNRGALVPESVAWHGHPQSLALTLPPLAAIYLAPSP